MGEARRRAFERPPTVQDLYLAFERYCDHEHGDTPAARRLDAAAAEIIERGMAGSIYHQQLAAEVMSRGTRLSDVRCRGLAQHRVCYALPGTFTVRGNDASVTGPEAAL